MFTFGLGAQDKEGEGQDESLEAQQQVAHNATPPPAAAPAALMSYNDASTKPSTLTLINDSPSIVQLTWVTFSGEEQVYNALQPGTTATQDTYSTHLWRLLNEDGQLLLQYTGPSARLEIPASAGQGPSVTVLGDVPPSEPTHGSSP